VIVDIVCGLGGLVVGVPLGAAAAVKFIFRVRVPSKAKLESVDFTMFHTSRDEP
jgi:hypothetical protein